MNVHKMDFKIPHGAKGRVVARRVHDISSTFWMNFEFTTTAARKGDQEGLPCTIG